MEVILQEDIPTLGKAGAIVKVREGYGRNYLLPFKKAVLADRKNRSELEHYQKRIEAKQTKIQKQALELKTKLDDFSVTIAKEAGEEDKLFGSVTTQEIAEALHAGGFSIDKRMIHPKQPLKSIGIFEVPIRLGSEISATIKVWVVKKE